VLQADQQALEEALRSGSVAFLLRQDVQHDPVLVHRAPKVMQDAPIRMSTSSTCHVSPSRGRRRTRLANSVPNFLHPFRMLPSCVTITPPSAGISSTSRRLRLKTSYSRTAWLVISAGKR
jgi:hypothetical protein